MTRRVVNRVVLVMTVVALSTLFVWRCTTAAVPGDGPPLPALESPARVNESPRNQDGPALRQAARIPSEDAAGTTNPVGNKPGPDATCAVWGFLRDSSGRAIPRSNRERSVLLRDAMGRGARAKFGDDEAYCATPGRAGLYTIEAWARGYERQRIDVVVSHASQQVDFVLKELNSISVEVNDLAGRPFTDILVDATSAESVALKASLGVVLGSGFSVGERMPVDVASVGDFTRAFSPQEPARIGWIDCGEIAPGGLDAALTLGCRIVATARLLAGEDLLSFRVDGLASGLIALDISVLDIETATPVAEGQIRVEAGELNVMTVLVEGRTTVLAPPGSVGITCLVPGFESVEERFDIDLSAPRHAVNLELRHSVGISGTLVSSEPGASLEGTSVYLCQVDAAGIVRPVTAPYWPGDDGAFEFWIGAGQYYVQVCPSPGSSDLVSDYVPASVSDAPLRELEVPVSACGALTLTNGGTAPASVRLRRNELTEDIGNLAAGKSTTLQLWPSLYEVELLVAGAPARSRVVQVAQGAVLELALDEFLSETPAANR